MNWTPRQHPRFRAALAVVLKPLDLEVPLRGHTSDISWGGMYVEMAFTQPVSTKVDITLWVGETKIHAQGIVVSNHPAFGNGIKFTELADSDRAHLNRLLHSLGLQALCAKAPVQSVAG